MLPCGDPENESADRVPRREFLAQAAGIASALTLGPRAVGWLRAAGLGASVAPALSGCSTVHRTAEDMARRLIIAINMDVRTLDPAMSNMALDGTIICLIHENLTWFDRKLRLIPRLALSWESPDGAMSWIFKLRPGVKFHDGTEFTADAVKKHFERIKNPATRSNRLNKVQDVEGIDVIDPLTVRFRMAKPHAMWPTVLRDAFASIACPTAIDKAEAMAAEENARKVAAAGTTPDGKPKEVPVPALSTEFYPRFPTGTGPYMFEAYEPDQYIRLRRNPNHRDVHLYHFEEVEFRPVREPTTRLIMLEQGRVDIAEIMEAHVEPAIKSGRVAITSVSRLRDSYIGLNYMKPPFNDVRVRQAVNYAVDRDDIVKNVFRGHAEPMLGPFPRSLPAFNTEMETYKYNPEKAKALLKEAGYEKGFEATLWAMDTATDTNLAVILSEQLRRLGIRLNIIRYDRAVYWDKFDAYLTNDGKKYPTKEGVFDMFVAGWTGGETPHGYLYYLFRSDDSSNSSFYENPEVDRLLAESLKTTDEAARDEIYKKLQEIIVTDAPWIFGYHNHLVLGMNPLLEGFQAHAAGDWDLEGVLRRGAVRERKGAE